MLSPDEKKELNKRPVREERAKEIERRKEIKERMGKQVEIFKKAHPGTTTVRALSEQKVIKMSKETKSTWAEIRERNEKEFEEDINRLTDYLEKYGDEEQDNLPFFDHNEMWLLFTPERKKLEGQGKRTRRQWTITTETVTAWEDFVTIFTGKPPTRGSGFSATLLELAIRTLMAVVAEFKVRDTGRKLYYTLINDFQREKVKQNLRLLADSIQPPKEIPTEEIPVEELE